MRGDHELIHADRTELMAEIRQLQRDLQKRKELHSDACNDLAKALRELNDAEAAVRIHSAEVERLHAQLKSEQRAFGQVVDAKSEIVRQRDIWEQRARDLAANLRQRGCPHCIGQFIVGSEWAEEGEP